MSPILNFDEYSNLTEEEQSRAVAITNPVGLYDPRELAAYAAEFLAAFHLNENQAVFSALGMDGILVPRMADAQGRGRLVDTGDLESTAKLAVLALNYLPDRQKLRPGGLSDTQWNMMLHLLNQAAGGSSAETGRLHDVPHSYGIDLQIMAGLGELEEELAGRPSQFDKIHIEIGEDQYRGVLAYVQTLDGFGDAVTVEVVADAWSVEAGTLLVDVMEHKVTSADAWARVNELASLVFPRSNLGRSGGEAVAASESLSVVTSLFSELVISGRAAGDAISGLRYLVEAADQVGNGRPYTPLSQLDQEVGGTFHRWVEIERQIDILVGVVIQYVQHASATPEGTYAALQALVVLTETLLTESEDQAIEAMTLHAQLVAQLTPMKEQQFDGRAPSGPQRPGWRR